MPTPTVEGLEKERISIRFPIAWRLAIKQRADSRGSDFSAYMREAALRFMEQEGITLSDA